MSLWQRIAVEIAAASGEDFNPSAPVGLSGGCINSAFRLRDGHRNWFIKTNRAALLAMFEAEAAALDALAATGTLRVPKALCTGTSDGVAYIVMEHIELGHAGIGGWRNAGEQLAALHRHTAKDFGWSRDNTIGATPQINRQESQWIEFWHQRRLGYQLKLAAENGYGGNLQRRGEQLMARFPALIDHNPVPSLLHGDLWGGNLAFDTLGAPVIYDPASYYGDREAELAMTELFGGFSTEFYAAYREAWPLDDGYRIRKTLYNLYHVLNHLNLFGGGYGAQAERMIDQLLSHC